MALYIIAIRLQPRCFGHAGIGLFKTTGADGAEERTWTQEALVGWVKCGGELCIRAVTGPPDLSVSVLDGNPRYLRAFDGHRATNAILELPRF